MYFPLLSCRSCNVLLSTVTELVFLITWELWPAKWKWNCLCAQKTELFFSSFWLKIRRLFFQMRWNGVKDRPTWPTVRVLFDNVSSRYNLSRDRSSRWYVGYLTVNNQIFAFLTTRQISNTSKQVILFKKFQRIVKCFIITTYEFQD